MIRWFLINEDGGYHNVIVVIIMWSGGYHNMIRWFVINEDRWLS